MDGLIILLLKILQTQLTHKQIQKGRKGRRLTTKIQDKILQSINECLYPNKITISDLFTYYGKKIYEIDVSKKFINVVGANEHNLQTLVFKMPRDKLTVITGLSGSEESSLAFDTIYAEGQRKYVETSHMLDNFLDSYKNQMLIYIDGRFRPQFQL